MIVHRCLSFLQLSPLMISDPIRESVLFFLCFFTVSHICLIYEDYVARVISSGNLGIHTQIFM